MSKIISNKPVTALEHDEAKRNNIQLQSIIVEGDDERFFSVAMQVAVREAKLGHGKLAEELRALIDEAKTRRGMPPHDGEKPIPIGRPSGELAGLLRTSFSSSNDPGPARTASEHLGHSCIRSGWLRKSFPQNGLEPSIRELR
jgi:hypothetical protein